MKQIEIKIPEKPQNSYPIIISEGLFKNPYEYIKKYTKANRFLVVTNTTVNKSYGKYFEKENAEFVILNDGEKYKNFESLNEILNKALEIKLERKDAIIALGGGVVGDMAGFAASIYRRGIDYIQVPTTLLAQTDSSVGGKTAINHPLGKNMIGSFYQPKLVLSDTDSLNTLDERQFKTGLAEVLKYAFIEKSCQADTDYKLFEFLCDKKEKIFNKDSETMSQLIGICCELKGSVVNKDEKENSLRAILNFGHTFAHALEQTTNYEKYTHGEAVSIGMKFIFDFALDNGYIEKNYHEKAINLLNEYGLLTKIDFAPDAEEFYEEMTNDKKVSDGCIKFVMPVEEKIVKIVNSCDRKNVITGIKRM